VLSVIDYVQQYPSHNHILILIIMFFRNIYRSDWRASSNRLFSSGVSIHFNEVQFLDIHVFSVNKCSKNGKIQNNALSNSVLGIHFIEIRQC
jgi:hypothetical protein